MDAMRPASAARRFAASDLSDDVAAFERRAGVRVPDLTRQVVVDDLRRWNNMDAVPIEVRETLVRSSDAAEVAAATTTTTVKAPAAVDAHVDE